MLSRFDFLKGTARLFGILVGDGLFFPIDETKFSKITVDKVKVFIFANHRKCFFYNCY